MHTWINNIQRFCIHDGPGIRTTVFFQGCNLRCRWCHNPDTISVRPVFRFIKNRCIGCKACIKACDAGALRWEERPFWREDLCSRCGSCRAECPSGACSLSAVSMSPEEILDIALRDKPFYESSGGGVTCSGGEPALSANFLCELLTLLKGKGIHTAVDTAAALPWERYETFFPVTDLFLVDYKLDDETRHRETTGIGHKQIKENLRRFAGCPIPVTVRIPIIPGINTEKEELEKMARYLSEICFAGRVELLKLHHLGESKYEALDTPYLMAGTAPPTDEEMERYRSIFIKHGISAASQ